MLNGNNPPLTMNALYNRKLQSALINTGKKVELNAGKGTPSVTDLKILFEKFASSSDISTQSKSVSELIAALVKWQVEMM